MTARQSAKVTRALKLVANGATPYAAAKKTGIALSTIYRAINRHRDWQHQLGLYQRKK
jgi:transposase